MRATRFYQSYFLLLPSSSSSSSTSNSRQQWALPDLNRELQISINTAGPELRLPDLSAHCQASTASSRSQSELPDLNRELQISVGTAGPHPQGLRATQPSSRYQDLNRECQIAVGTGHQPRAPDLSDCTPTASARSQRALPDPNCEGQISVRTAGPQLWAPDQT